MKWLDALSDCVEAKQSSESNTSQPLNPDDIKWKGALMYKSTNRITGLVTMKRRFFVIQKGYLSYYDKESDMINEKEPLNEISLMQISKVESCDFEKCSPGTIYHLYLLLLLLNAIIKGSGIAIHAKVIKGGDDNGDRIFELDARSPFEAKTWMEEICKATGKYQLKPKNFGNGYESFVVQSTDKARHASIMIKANASVGQSEPQRRTSTNVLFKRTSFTQSSSTEQSEQTNLEGEKNTNANGAKPLIVTAGGGRGGSNLLGGGRGRGRGNRGSIIPHAKQEADEIQQSNDTDINLEEVVQEN